MKSTKALRFILFLAVIILLIIGTRAKAQSFEYPVEVNWSKNLSNVVLILSEDHPEFMDAEQIIVSSASFDKLLVPTTKKQTKKKVQLISKKEFKAIIRQGETFDVEFYKGGVIIYKLVVIPTKDETSFYYQEIGGSNWIGWIR